MTEKEETNEQQPTLLLSITAMPNGGVQIERNVCPELLGLLTLEIEIIKGFMLQQQFAQQHEPVFQEDTSKGEGH